MLGEGWRWRMWKEESRIQNKECRARFGSDLFLFPHSLFCIPPKSFTIRECRHREITERAMETGRFSPEMPTILRGAREAALRLGQDYIGTEHLLIGLLDENGRGAALLGHLVDIDAVRKRIDAMVMPRPGDPLETSENLPLTRQAEGTIRTATAEAARLGSETVGSAHILLALMKGGHLGAQVLQSLAVSHEQIETLLNQEKPKGG
jgi:hypothetical protein